MRRIRILEEAAVEAIEAAAWYEQERAGLGIEFDHAVNAALDLLEEEVVPLTSIPGFTSSGAKRLILKRFPYDIVVREYSEEIVVVAWVIPKSVNFSHTLPCNAMLPPVPRTRR